MKTSILLLLRLVLVFGIIAGLSHSRLAAQTSTRAVSWSSLDFGSVVLFESAFGTATLENLTQDTLFIENADGNDRELSFRVPLDINGLRLLPQQKLSVARITFAPRSIGLKLADVVVRYRRNGLVLSDTLRNALVGKGTHLKVIVPDTVFGRVGQQTPVAVMVVNRGGVNTLTTFQRMRTFSSLPRRAASFGINIFTTIPSNTFDGGDTVFLPLVFSPLSSGSVDDRLEIIINTVFGNDTLLITLIGNAKLPVSADITFTPKLSVVKDSVKPGETVELILSFESTTPLFSILRTTRYIFRATFAIGNRNILALHPQQQWARNIGRNVEPTRFITTPLTWWYGRSDTLCKIQCLAMIGDTDLTSIELVELIWGSAAQGKPLESWERTVFIEPAPAILFTVKTPFTGGGKRLFTPAKANALVQSLAPNPATSASELNYTLAENTVVECALINAHGIAVKQLWSGMQPSGTHTLTIPTDDLASGLYAVRLQTLHGTEHVMLRVFR